MAWEAAAWCQVEQPYTVVRTTLSVVQLPKPLPCCLWLASWMANPSQSALSLAAQLSTAQHSPKRWGDSVGCCCPRCSTFGT